MSSYLRAIMRGDDPPLYVITADDGSERSGCVAGFVTQCSIYPERLLVCISRLNHTHEVARWASALGVHLLSGADDELARRFGEESGDTVDKFAGVDPFEAACGAPILQGHRPWVAGKVFGVYPLGDHDGFVIEPSESGGSAVESPLRMNEIKLEAGHPPSEILGPSKN